MKTHSVSIIVSLFLPALTAGFGVKDPVSKLVTKTYVQEIARLKEETKSIVGSIDELPYSNDMFYLRFCLDGKGTDGLKEALEWRQGPGSAICQAAKMAVQKATEGQGWNNDPARNDAPHSGNINKYITPKTSLTTKTSQGDLMYCIRAGFIDVEGLVGSLDNPADQLSDFFLYCKEVNSLVLNERSLEEDKVLYLLTVNDLQGLKLLGGGQEDALFREALSSSSKQGNVVYPGLAGPTLLLNLPKLLTFIVKLFTPLFPPEVSARLKFESGPLSKVKDLSQIGYGGSEREKFLKEIDKLCY